MDTSVLDEFSIAQIKELTAQHFNYRMSEEDEIFFLQYISKQEKSGLLYILDEEGRIKILKALDERGVLSQLATKIESKPGDTSCQQMLKLYLTRLAPELKDQNIDQLVASYRIANWLKGTSYNISIESIHAYLKREELLQPFRVLTQYFQGRQKDLEFLQDYVYSPAQEKKPPLLISGIGGIGKSTLVAKFILEHHAKDHLQQMPFIYLDFDRLGLSLKEPLLLASEGLRQLMIQFHDLPKAVGVFQDIREDIKTYLDKNQEDNFSQKSGSTEVQRTNFYKSLARQYGNSYQFELQNSPALVVLDSFEDAQFRASGSELDRLFNFFKEIQEIVPKIRFIIAGRNELIQTHHLLVPYPLTEFDTVAAQGFLAAKGISDANMCEKIVEKFGGNPLVLKLAADHVLNYYEQNLNGVPNFETLFADIDKVRSKEQLIRRNLLHIQSPEARKIASPGMVVRCISPEIIQKVLAEPCELGPITIEKAKEIFQILQKANFLLTMENGQLIFKRELRMALIDLIVAEHPGKNLEIHRLAVQYYASRTEAADRAEYLYHRLMQGDNPKIIDEIYSDPLRSYIENALLELPLNAYVHLAAKMGITAAESKVKKANLSEWEIYVATQIEDVFEDGDETGLRRVRATLKDRTERTGGKPLCYLEAKTYARLEEYTLAKQFVEPRQMTQLDFTLLQSQMLEAAFKFKEAFELLYSFNVKQSPDLSIPTLSAYLISLLRNAKRTGQSLETVIAAVELAAQRLDLKTSQSKSDRLNELRTTLSLPYKIICADIFQTESQVDSAKKIALSYQSL